MDTTEALNTLPMLVRMLAALTVVVALMGGLALILRKAGLSGALPQNQGKKAQRLKVIERLPLDTRRQLVIFSCDDQEHLAILSATGETLVKTDINAAQAAPPKPPAKKRKSA